MTDNWTSIAHARLGDIVDGVEWENLVVATRRFADGTNPDTILDYSAEPEHVVLTQDGGHVELSLGHRGPQPLEDLVPYEVHGSAGLLMHGFVHCTTRAVVTTNAD